MSTLKPKFSKAIFPGSFDPFHDGHYHILLKANALFDEVIIFIGNNPNKNSNNFETRLEQVKSYLASKQLNNLVVYGPDYTVDIAKKFGCDYIVRGLRNSDDFMFESKLFRCNKNLAPQIETVYFMSDKDYIDLHSHKK